MPDLNGMLKKAASFVLASLGPSTYPRGYASGPHLLRPRRSAFLTIPHVRHFAMCSSLHD